MNDFKTWALGIMTAISAFFLLREFKRRDSMDEVIGNLKEAVTALQAAVRALERLNEHQSKAFDQHREEFGDLKERVAVLEKRQGDR